MIPWHKYRIKSKLDLNQILKRQKKVLVSFQLKAFINALIMSIKIKTLMSNENLEKKTT